MTLQQLLLRAGGGGDFVLPSRQLMTDRSPHTVAACKPRTCKGHASGTTLKNHEALANACS